MSASLSVAGEQSERVCILRRVFRPTSLDSSSESPVASMYLDMESGNDSQQRELLQSTAPEYFAAASRSAKYELNFRSGIDPGNDEHRAYLSQFLDDACTMLLDSLDSAEAALAKEPDPLNDEVKLHLAFAELRARRFSPTASSSAALARAKTCISGNGGSTCVVYGPSGAGKTYVVAKLVADLSSERRTCVVRFLGTSGDSADVASLLRSICDQLRAISMGREAFVFDATGGAGLGPCPAAFEELVKYFREALTKWSWGAVVLVLESLDQLNDAFAGRGLGWLLVDGFSDLVHIVCSTLPDELNPEVGRPYRCLSILKKRIRDAERFIDVAALQDIRQLIEHLLQLKGRRVNDAQLGILVKTVKEADGKAQTPLMATLITDKASQWKSSTPAPASLPLTVRESIVEFFGDLISYFQELENSEHAGERLVTNSLSYITLVVKGISGTELQEVLSLDDDVLADSHRWWFTPHRKLPSAPLLLLLGLLAPYLSSRGQSMLNVWYHRQFWESAGAHFLKDDEFRAQRHHLLAEFFCGKFCGEPKPCSDALRIRLGLSDEEASVGVNRHVRDQPLALKGASAFHPGAVINDRRSAEALLHMVAELEILKKMAVSDDNHHEIRRRISECSKMAEGELCTSAAVCARGLTGETFNMVRQSATFLQLVSGEDVDHAKVDHFNRWIRRDAHELNSAGTVAASALSQPAVSKARAQHMSERERVPGLPWLVLGGSLDFDAIVSVLKGHEGAVTCTDWHESRIVSGDGAGMIIVWDAFTGEKVMELKGHSGRVESVKWSPNGSQVASGSADKTVIIWDAATGDKVSQLKGHSSDVMSVAWSPRAPCNAVYAIRMAF